MSIWQRISAGAGALFCGSNSVTPDVGTAFTAAIIALGAKMAKADGVVSPVEVEVFHQVFRTPPEEAAHVARLFDLAKQDTAGFELYADRIRTLLANDHQMLRDVLDGLFHIASADRAIHPGEDAFLRTVAEHFGLSDSEFRHVRAQFVEDETSPYDVLHIDPAASDAEIKARHRKLVRQTHPDLLMGRGVPKEMIEVATRKLAAINSAFEAIAKERGL